MRRIYYELNFLYGVENGLWKHSFIIYTYIKKHKHVIQFLTSVHYLNLGHKH